MIFKDSNLYWEHAKSIAGITRLFVSHLRTCMHKHCGLKDIFIIPKFNDEKNEIFGTAANLLSFRTFVHLNGFYGSMMVHIIGFHFLDAYHFLLYHRTLIYYIAIVLRSMRLIISAGCTTIRFCNYFNYK